MWRAASIAALFVCEHPDVQLHRVDDALNHHCMTLRPSLPLSPQAPPSVCQVMADFVVSELHFDSDFAFWGSQSQMPPPISSSYSTVPLAGTKRGAENVIAEAQPHLSGLTSQNEYRSEHIDPRNICCSLPICCPPSCEAINAARAPKRRAVAGNPKASECHQAATCSNLEPCQDQTSSETLHDTFCHAYSPCDSPECIPGDVCFDPDCDQAHECADQCSHPECSKGTCPETECFCSKCCVVQPCPLENFGDDCQLAHCPELSIGSGYCPINEPCQFTGYAFGHAQLNSFNNYLCPSNGHGTPVQSAMDAHSPTATTPALSPTNYTPLESGFNQSSPPLFPGADGTSFTARDYQCHVDTPCCSLTMLPNGGQANGNQCSPGGWALPPQHTGRTIHSHRDPSTNGRQHSQISFQSTQWAMPDTSSANSPASYSEYPGTSLNHGLAAWSHYEPKPDAGVMSADHHNKLDYLASAAQENLVKSEFDDSNKILSCLSSHGGSVSQTPQPAACVCKWQHMSGVTCLQAFDSPAALHNHLKAAHVDDCSQCFCQWAGCDSCDKDFKQRSKLSRHLLGHAGHRPYACTFEGCNKTFATNQAKDNHERTHTGDKPYVCQECGYTTTTHTQLYTHINALHEKKKKHKCRFCEFTCADSSNLSKHERTHQVCSISIAWASVSVSSR